MKNVSSMKSTNKIESPKTPGGISKSLLTPCRRVGLSRSWRKSGPSPFISPLSTSQNNINETQQEKNPRKRKKDSPEKEIDEENLGYTETSTILERSTSESEENLKTPTRTNLIRKRCKTLLLVKESQESECLTEKTESNEDLENISHDELNADTRVSKLSRHHSRSKMNKNKSHQKYSIEKPTKSKGSPTIKTNLHEKELQKTELVNTIKKSPQNLTTECIVVIQKEIINKDNLNKPEEKKEPETTCPQPSQALYDSESDDVPLCQINKKPTNNSVNIHNKMDLCDKKKENKITKLEDKKISTTDLKSAVKKTNLSRKNSNTEKVTIPSKPSSQSSNSFDDDDDYNDFDHKRTIIIKKSYDKVTKPLKAKSTGSITDKDIDELKARIEAKKKLLMVKALGNDTKDLRELIKKWQKGCQDALLELMELMKKKMPDQVNIENAQLLQMLKIPQDLVGYDSENDCFNSPNDTNIILSSLKI